MIIEFIDRQTGKKHKETPPAEGLLQFLYDNPFGKTAILPIAKRKFISAWYGRRMDKPESVNRIQDFVDQLRIDMSESVKSIDEFTSFNDFFYRHLKPEARPIGEGLVSPGDGKLLAFENIADLDSFFVKGSEFTLAQFLADTALAKQYQNHAMIILRLAPNDYHRYHFPYAGTPTAMTRIQGSYYSVSPYALANNFVRVFCENKREYCILKTANKGDVLLVPVGATMVGGIVDTYSVNKAVQKGDEMGYFKFGGSTVVILLDKTKFQIDQDLIDNTKNKMETFVRMGERIGS